MHNDLRGEVRIEVGRREVGLVPTVCRVDQLAIVSVFLGKQVELDVRVRTLTIAHPNAVAQHNVVLIACYGHWAAVNYR